MSHAEGSSSIANGQASHAEGWNSVTSGAFQLVIGQNNISSSFQSAFIIGNGTSATNRSNLLFASSSIVQITGSLNVTGSITLSDSVPYSAGKLTVSSFAGKSSVVDGVLVLTSNEAGSPYPTQLRFNQSGSTAGWTIQSVNQGVGYTPLILNQLGGGTVMYNTQITGSLGVSGSNTLIGTKTITGSVFISGSKTIIGTNTVTGSMLISGSQTFNGVSAFYGNHTLSGSNTIVGNTIMSGSIEVSGSSNFHNSIFIVTGSTAIKGITSISGSTSITGSFDVVDGNINIVSGSGFYRWGNKLFNYGQFANTGSIAVTASVSGAFPYTTTYFGDGISIVSSSRITFANSGIYNIQFSALANQGTGTRNLHIWFKKTGSNIDNSDTYFNVAANTQTLVAWNFAYPMSASEYVEIWYYSDGTNTSFPTNVAGSGFPASPSIITTITQIA